MGKDKLDLQVLLEIALNQHIQGQIETDLDRVINLYMRKLTCFGVAIYKKESLLRIRPQALLNHPKWTTTLESISLEVLKNPSKHVHIADADGHHYGLSLAEYGSLVLMRKTELGLEMLHELNKVADQLGRDLTQSDEAQRLKLLQSLFDHSSDSVLIAEDDGRVHYFNELAANRLGIQRAEVGVRYIQDFKDLKLMSDDRQISLSHPGEWQTIVQGMLQNQGQITVEATNVNKHTGTVFPLEIIANLIEINSKRFVIAISRDISERKRQEQILKDTSMKLESILYEMTDVVWSVSVPDYKIIFVTPSVESLYEMNTAQWMEDSSLWEKVIHHDDKHIIFDIQQQLELLGSYNARYRIITPTGNVKWVRNTGKYVYDADKNPIRIDRLVVDRTNQYNAQETLEQEVRLQEALIDIASTYINLDPKDVEETINRSLEKMGRFVSADRAYIFDYDFANATTSNTYEWCKTGITAEIGNLQDVPMEYFPQWIERHLKNEAFYVPDVSGLNSVEEAGLRSVLEPQGIKSLIAIPMKDGDDLLGFVGFDSVEHHHLYSEKEKKLLYLFGQMLINIRNRQKWENQLRIQEEKYRNIIANMNLGLLEATEDNTILFANQTFCGMSGFDLHALIGNKTDELFKPLEKKPVPASLGSHEIQIETQAGDRRWWFSSTAQNYNDKGQLTGRIGVYLDITNQKRLESELATAKTAAEDASQSKEQFLASMSHEIRTPLNVIIGMIRELGKHNLGADQRFFVTQSDAAAKHLLTILNHILDMAKIDAGELSLESNDFSIQAVTSNVHSILHNQAKEKNIGFELHLDPAIHPVHVGDNVRLRQVLMNVLGNAIKFTDTGSVHVSVELVDDFISEQSILFTVTDTGIGMSDHFQQDIFKKFSQEQTASNRKYEGTGLGLSISRELVVLMGGDIEVKSRKGVGTTIRFKLTLPKGNKANLRFSGGGVQKMVFEGKRVLLVEDSDMNRFIAIQTLRHFGCLVDEATNGLEAIEILKKQTYDLILMDIQMPVMDGVDATLHIRNELKLDIPIIALTANAFRHDIVRYLNAGMDAFVIKPFSEEELYAKMRQVSEASSRTPNQADADTPLFDLTELLKLSRGDKPFVQKMVGMFIQLSTETTQGWTIALETHDYSRISKSAHRIKPSIDYLGIRSLRQPIRDLELFPVDGDPKRRVLLVAQISDILKKVAKQLGDLPI